MQQSVQISKMNADKKRKFTFEDDSYRPEKKISQVYRQLFRFWIHVYSAEWRRKTSVCYKQQGIGH